MPKNAEKICSATVGKILRSKRRFFPTVAWEIRFIRFFRPLPVMIVVITLLLHALLCSFCLSASTTLPHLHLSFVLPLGSYGLPLPTFWITFCCLSWLTIWQCLCFCTSFKIAFLPIFAFFALSIAIPLLPAPLPTIVLYISFFPHPLHLLHHPLHSPWPWLPPIFAFLNPFTVFPTHMCILFYIQCIYIINSNQQSIFDRFFWKQ